MKNFPMSPPKFCPRNFSLTPISRWNLIGRETKREIQNGGMRRLKLKKFTDHHAIDPHGDSGCASFVERETSRGISPFTSALEAGRKIRRETCILSCRGILTNLSSERATEGSVAFPKVTAEPGYICGNGKSTDTPKLMGRAGCTANPTLSLPGQIEFREDCVTLPPPRGRYFHFGQLSANIMLWRTAPNVQYVYCYLAVTARREQDCLSNCWKKRKEQ